MEAVFFGPAPRLYNEDPKPAEIKIFSQSKDELALSAIPSAWGYNRATLFLGDINTGT
jgi:hypothetical protein